MNLYDKVKASVTIESMMSNFEGKSYTGGTRYDHCLACNTTCTSVFSVKANGTGHCFQCGFTGSVIDLYAAMTGKTTMQAAQALADDLGLNKTDCIRKPQLPKVDLPKIEVEKRQASLQIALKKLQEALLVRLSAKPNPTARRYLTEQRSIDESVVSMAEQRKLVAYLPANPNEAQALLDTAVGRDLLVEAGLMRRDANMSAIAFRPLVFFMPGCVGAEFRLVRKAKDEPKSIRYGELKFPYWWSGTAETVTVVEGVIDLLSIVSLGQKGTVIALPGCQSWRQDWPARIQQKYGTNSFVLALDADDAGEMAATKIAAGLHRDAFQCTRLRPGVGCKDWNDVLINATNKLLIAA